jgi:hypothetical protein
MNYEAHYSSCFHVVSTLWAGEQPSSTGLVAGREYSAARAYCRGKEAIFCFDAIIALNVSSDDLNLHCLIRSSFRMHVFVMSRMAQECNPLAP